MKTLNLTQGSPEWDVFRDTHNTASEAPAMMGAHSKISRNDLLRARHSGADSEISRYVREVIFERGHEAEAAVRPAAEAEINDELFPATVVDDADWLSASLDGITMDETVIWENKQFNQAKVDHIAEHQTCPPEDVWQVMQQLYITGAERCLYTVGNDPDNVVKVWVKPDDKAFAKLLSAWKQFEQDLNSYEPPEDEPVAVGRTMESLPALHIEMKGEVTASNLAEYKTHALTVFESINTDLQTDQDFADAEQCVKWCADIESRLDAAKQHALSQTADIDALFRDIDDIKESARQKRLALDKLVKQRKQSIRGEIRQEAENALTGHIKRLEERLEGRVRLPAPAADFAAAMKNKRTISSLRDAVDQVLANAKITANETADTIQANLKAFDQVAADYTSLFPDLAQIVCKAPDDFQAAVKLRIADHKEKEEKRLEAERERIRAEEEAKARAAAEKPAEQPAPAETDPRYERHEKVLAETTAQLEREVNGNVTWDVVSTFRIAVPEDIHPDTIKARIEQALADAGATTQQTVITRHKETAAA